MNLTHKTKICVAPRTRSTFSCVFNPFYSHCGCSGNWERRGGSLKPGKDVVEVLVEAFWGCVTELFGTCSCLEQAVHRTFPASTATLDVATKKFLRIYFLLLIDEKVEHFSKQMSVREIILFA